jgi:hypothetical protein
VKLTARYRMLEAKLHCVKGLSPQVFKGFCRWFSQSARARFEAGAVCRITHHGVADVREVHANLMRAAGFERQTKPRSERFVIRSCK